MMFYFSFISHVRASEIKVFISVLFQFNFMLCEPLKEGKSPLLGGK